MMERTQHGMDGALVGVDGQLQGNGGRPRPVAVANCGASDRSIGSNSARAAAPGSFAGLPRFSDHADVHRWQRLVLWGRR